MAEQVLPPAPQNLHDTSNDARVIDCHVHLAALPDGDNGCVISPTLLKSPLFRFFFWKHRLPRDNPRGANEKYLQDLLVELRASQRVRQAVLLAMDGVYDTQGRLDLSQTEFLVSNTYVLEVARRYPEQFLAGVSINPQRRDAIDEVHRCADAGAVLVKVLPNAQHFDPAQRSYLGFYRALAERRLPLLSHVGYEFSLIGKDQSVGDPDRLQVPLDEGTTVIAAHACSYGIGLYERFLPTFNDLVRRYPHFYADISALTLINRMGMLRRLQGHPELHGRLLFGTDYPLPVLHLPAWGRVGWRTVRTLMATKNRFDRQYAICQALGVDFHSIEALLCPPRPPAS